MSLGLVFGPALPSSTRSGQLSGLVVGGKSMLIAYDFIGSLKILFLYQFTS